MSCMMMKLEPMAALANAIATRLNCGQEYWGFDISDQLHRAAKDCRTAGAYYAEEIYQRLYALNVRAYNSRYKYAPAVRAEDEDAPVIDGSRYVVHHPPTYREHGFAVCPWHYQLAMLLDFWIYQTDEGEVAKDPLRLGIMEFRDMLYRFIIQNSPGYFSIPWGELPASKDLPCPSEDQEGVCPVCGGEIEYCGEFDLGDDGGTYGWTCLECGASGKEGYDLVFDGHHYDVRDADGKCIS